MKRGQSGIIIIILLILTSLVAIIIVWNVVRNINKPGEENVNQITTQLSTKDVDLTKNPILIPVTKNTEEGEISSVKIVFKNPAGETFIYENSTVPSQFETKVYSIKIPVGFIPVSFEVYPILKTSNGNLIGIPAYRKGGGGGGSGGGGGGSSTTPSNNVVSCIENWNCTNWGSCLNNQQNSTCIDLNNCGTIHTKPAESQACCSPSCIGKQCGDDGCGGSCGSCRTGLVCNVTGSCKVDWCNGADMDRDGDVDSGDLGLWQANYNPLGNPVCESLSWCHGADADKDGDVDSGDLGLWQANYNPLGNPACVAEGIESSCKPSRTCQSLGYSCGEIDDGCKYICGYNDKVCSAKHIINCGTCQENQVCGDDRKCRTKPDYNSYDDVLLVINDNSEVSKQIGNYFKQQRNIPDKNVVHIRTSTDEWIWYDGAINTFNNEVRYPILNHIKNNDLYINYIVLTKGIFHAIYDPNNFSYYDTIYQHYFDTDAILYTVLRGGCEDYLNYSQYKVVSDKAVYEWNNRLRHECGNFYGLQDERFSHDKYNSYLVTRLDGYNFDEVKKLIDNAELGYIGEGTVVLDESQGWCPLFAQPKTQGLTDPVFDWKNNNEIFNMEKYLGDAGYNVVRANCTNYSFLMNQNNIIAYFSWGTNDPYYPWPTGTSWSMGKRGCDARIWNIKFIPGSIGGTHVSSSARYMSEQNWNTYPEWCQSQIIDLIHSGLTAGIGYASEPDALREYTPITSDRYFVKGYNLADSFYMGDAVGHHQGIIIGDPKMRLKERSGITGFLVKLFKG